MENTNPWFIEGKYGVSWNMDFDWKLMIDMFRKCGIERSEIAGASCAIDKYSEWCGQWNTKRDGIRWQNSQTWQELSPTMRITTVRMPYWSFVKWLGSLMKKNSRKT